MGVHRRAVRRPFLAPEARLGDESAAGGIRIRHPHPEATDAVGEWRGEPIAAVDDLEGRYLCVGEARSRAAVGRSRAGVVGAAFRLPWIATRRSLTDVETRAARDVVVDHTVDEAVQPVALAHEL